MDNLFLAWDEFKRGKRKKKDVQEFEYNLEDNIFQLHWELKTRTYQHSDYTSFYIKDPKLRHIHKACVRDRVLHHAVFRILYSLFDPAFIFDSYSCRINKGTHRAVRRLEKFLRKASKNNTKTCYALKCDIKKFFDSMDQNVLVSLIQKKIQDQEVIWLVNKIIKSFQVFQNKGLSLGNVTSQLFANIYLNELDQFVKHRLRLKYYIRYCDDFVILSQDEFYLKNLIDLINSFLLNKLKLRLHPEKIIIRKFQQGIDFLGYVILPYCRVLRTKTKRRIFKKLEWRVRECKEGKVRKQTLKQSFQSYLGVLFHANTYKLKQKLKAKLLFWINP